GYVMPTYEYGAMYRRIRATNIAIQHLQEPKFDNTALAQRLLGEAYFLRAYYYHQLLRFYGAVPIVNFVYTLGDAQYTKERNTFEQCVDFIVNDCDSAAMLLQGSAQEDGRANEMAALALKSRVLTYAASDLYDNATAIGYTSVKHMDRCEKAKAASTKVLDHVTYQYKLDFTAPVAPEERKTNCMALAMGGGSKMADADAKRHLTLRRFFSDLTDE